MMNKVISTITFLLIATAALAGNNEKESESANTPANASQEITFDVNGLSACSGEFETTDAVLEFVDVNDVKASKTNIKWVLLTETIEDSVTLEFQD